MAERCRRRRRGGQLRGGRCSSGVQFAPGNDPFVITVGAADIGTSVGAGDDSSAPWSAWGYTPDGFMKPELAAPGRYMIGPVPDPRDARAERPDHVTSRRIHAAERHVVRGPGGCGCGGDAPRPASELDAGSGQGRAHAHRDDRAEASSSVSSASESRTSRRSRSTCGRPAEPQCRRSTSSSVRQRTARRSSTPRPGSLQPMQAQLGRRSVERCGLERRSLVIGCLGQRGMVGRGLGLCGLGLGGLERRSLERRGVERRRLGRRRPRARRSSTYGG